MAKPINLYQGQAPSAFGQMGAGIAEAGAGIAKAIQAGDAQMGAGIAGGVNAAVGEYMKYKDMKSAVTASEKAYGTLRSFLPKELQFAMDAQIESMGSDTGISLNDKKHFWEQTNAMLGTAVKQAMDLQKQQKEIDARAGLQAAGDAAALTRAELGESGATKRTLLGIQSRAEELGGQALPTDPSAATPNALMPGAQFYDQGLQGAQQQPNPVGSFIKKRHFGTR